MLGPIISAGANLIGGLIGSSNTQKANAQAAQQAELNRQMQLDFAQKGIRWKVRDAQAAGVHPLYALGASTSSYAPVSLGVTADTSLPNAIANMGQDMSRSINATRTAPERVNAFHKTVQDLSLTKMGLENEVLAAQVAKLRASTNPPIPAIGPLPPIGEEKKQADRPPLQFGGSRIMTDPLTSNFDEYSKRYGDEGIPQWAIAPGIMYRDFMETTQGATRPNPIFHYSIRPGSYADRFRNWYNSR